MKPRSNASVLRVDRLALNVTPGEIRRHFKEHGARPDDIHLILEPNGKHNGSALLVFASSNYATIGLNANDSLLKDKRLLVRESNPGEFNKHFPGVPMFSYASIRGSANRGGIRGRGGFYRGRGGFSRDSNIPPSFGEGSLRGTGRRFSYRRSSIGEGFTSPHRHHENESDRRPRSRSPIRNDRNARESFLRNFTHDSSRRPDQERQRSNHGDVRHRNAELENHFGNINERKYVLVSGMHFRVSEVEIQNFFRPVLTRDILFKRNVGGKFAGKPNGNALIEFFSESDARQSLKCHGKRFGNKTVSVVRAKKEEIWDTIQVNGLQMNGPGTNTVKMPDIANLNTVANQNPQVQALLTLLTATVNSIAGGSSNPPDYGSQSYRNEPSSGGRRNRYDPVISRVANSANIDVNDIKMGRAVGIRNLPYEVTPDEILQFFRNFYAIPDSVRIHYLEDGRCSGDAIISFQSSKDARNAVSSLNKRSIGRRKVELFFL